MRIGIVSSIREPESIDDTSDKREISPSAINAVPVPALNIKQCAVNGAEECALEHHEADEDEH